jgi:hypothetical protein
MNVLKAVRVPHYDSRKLESIDIFHGQLFPRQSAEQRDNIIDEILSSVFKVAEMKKTQTHIRSAFLAEAEDLSHS